MATQNEPEIILYDLANIKNVCFSPSVWRIRLLLNYKRIPYRTIFLEFPDIEHTLKGLGLIPGLSVSGQPLKYTVPAIQHVPTNIYMMESAPIAQFLESTYPDLSISLQSELGQEIEAKSHNLIGTAFRLRLMPREIKILSPRAQSYFRRTREAVLGYRLEDLIDPEKEERYWAAIDENMRAVGKLIRTHKADGPFILGARPSYTDFVLVGSLQSAKVIDEEVFEKVMKYKEYKDVYEACLPYMEKRD